MPVKRLPPLMACVLLVAVGSCGTTEPDGGAAIPPGLSGEWNFTRTWPGDEAGDCVTRGNFLITATGTALAGTVTSFASNCNMPVSGAITAGSVRGTDLVFQAAGCDYTGRAFGSGPDSLAGSFACTPGPNGSWVAVPVGPPVALTVSPQFRDLVAGGTVQLAADLTDAEGNSLYGRDVTWTTSHPGIATVSLTGLVTGVGPGAVAIVAAAGGLRDTAVVAVSTPGFFVLAAGGHFTCGVSTSGFLYCWGANDYGQLGDGTVLSSNTPVPTAGLRFFASVSAGIAHACGLLDIGGAYCWGANGGGRLGDGTETDRSEPTAVVGGPPLVQIVAGGYHTCGLTAAGAVFCWGWNNRGQLGDGTRANHPTPVAVVGGYAFASLSAAGDLTCGVTAAGAAYCWGDDSRGQLGNGTVDSAGFTSPQPVSGGVSFAQLSVGRLHACGLTAGGQAFCWGDGVYGQLGNGSRANRTAPTAVAGSTAFTTITIRQDHTCALASDGSAWCWGSNGAGQCGVASPSEVDPPVAVSGSLVFRSLTAGGVHTCGVTTAGVAYCWGYNSNGQIGDGTRTDRRAPVRVVGQP